jgi:hypothetical protein
VARDFSVLLDVPKVKSDREFPRVGGADPRAGVH